MLEYLERRGPDAARALTRSTIAKTEYQTLPWLLTATSSILSLRGNNIIRQPLEDLEFQSDSFLSWNGEAWRFDGKSIRGSDVDVIFRHLLTSANTCKDNVNSDATSRESAFQAVLATINKIAGPYAFVFYDAMNRRVFYGRDALGRRSLLIRRSSNSSIELVSVCGDRYGEGWVEVENDGLNVLDLGVTASTRQGEAPFTGEGSCLSLVHVPWKVRDRLRTSFLMLVNEHTFPITGLTLTNDRHPLSPLSIRNYRAIFHL